MAIRSNAVADTPAVVLRDIQRATGWTQTLLATRLGVSAKTLGRYLAGTHAPPERSRHSMVHTLHDVDAALVSRLARSLGVTDDFPYGVPRRGDTNAASECLEAALTELSSELDTGAQKTRAALATFLMRLGDAGVDAPTAQVLLVAGGKKERKR